MINTRAANRYAKAFFSITKSEDDLMIMFKDMSLVKKAFKQSEELKLFIDSKIIKDTENIEINPAMIQPVKEIKSLGNFKVFLNLHSEIQSQISIKVLTKEEN